MARKISPSTTLKELEKRLGFSLNQRHENGRKVRNDKQVKTFRKEQSRQK